MLTKFCFEPLDEVRRRKGIQLDALARFEEFTLLRRGLDVVRQAAKSEIFRLQAILFHIRETQAQVGYVDVILEFIFHEIIATRPMGNTRETLSNDKPGWVEIV